MKRFSWEIFWNKYPISGIRRVDIERIETSLRERTTQHSTMAMVKAEVGARDSSLLAQQDVTMSLVTVLESGKQHKSLSVASLVHMGPKLWACPCVTQPPHYFWRFYIDWYETRNRAKYALYIFNKHRASNFDTLHAQLFWIFQYECYTDIVNYVECSDY